MTKPAKKTSTALAVRPSPVKPKPSILIDSRTGKPPRPEHHASRDEVADSAKQGAFLGGLLGGALGGLLGAGSAPVRNMAQGQPRRAEWVAVEKSSDGRVRLDFHMGTETISIEVSRAEWLKILAMSTAEERRAAGCST